MSSRRTLLVGVVVLAGVVAVGLTGLLAPPGNPPEYAEVRPDPVAEGYVSHTAAVFVAVPPAAFTGWVDAPGRELGDLVAPVDGLPAVVGTQALRGEWDPAGDRTGDRRRVQFADGHFLAEEVLVDTPDRFRYVIWGFTGPQRLAVAHAVAEFTYAEQAGGTLLTWTYSFLPTAGLARPFVEGFVGSTIASMMDATLEGMRSGAERDLP